MLPKNDEYKNMFIVVNAIAVAINTVITIVIITVTAIAIVSCIVSKGSVIKFVSESVIEDITRRLKESRGTFFH